MKDIKKFMIAGTIFVSIFGTLLHFVYRWSGYNFIVGLFAAISESTWEHMKLVFFPMLIVTLYANKKLKNEYPCISSAMAFAALLAAALIPIIFYTYSGILGFNIAIIDIASFYISVIIAFYIGYKLTVSCRLKPYTLLLNILLVALTIAFIIFSVFPPNIGIFISPV